MPSIATREVCHGPAIEAAQLTYLYPASNQSHSGQRVRTAEQGNKVEQGCVAAAAAAAAHMLAPGPSPVGSV